MVDLDKVLALVRAMNAGGVEYAVLWAPGVIDATEHVEVFIAPDAGNIERLKKALHSVWNDPAIDEISADELAGDYPSVRYGPPDTELYIDFLTRLGEMYSFDNLEWQMAEIEGVPIRVVTPLQLYRMKRDTVRPKDRADADALRQAFALTEE